jgi:hypothetical protein
VDKILDKHGMARKPLFSKKIIWSYVNYHSSFYQVVTYCLLGRKLDLKHLLLFLEQPASSIQEEVITKIERKGIIIGLRLPSDVSNVAPYRALYLISSTRLLKSLFPI